MCPFYVLLASSLIIIIGKEICRVCAEGHQGESSEGGGREAEEDVRRPRCHGRLIIMLYFAQYHRPHVRISHDDRYYPQVGNVMVK